MSVYDTLKTLGITLPELARPGAVYVPFVRAGNLVYVSGHIARKNGEPWVGQLGGGLTTAARTSMGVFRRARSSSRSSW